jgi:hypothetical protein
MLLSGLIHLVCLNRRPFPESWWLSTPGRRRVWLAAAAGRVTWGPPFTET